MNSAMNIKLVKLVKAMNTLFQGISNWLKKLMNGQANRRLSTLYPKFAEYCENYQ